MDLRNTATTISMHATSALQMPNLDITSFIFHSLLKKNDNKVIMPFATIEKLYIKENVVIHDLGERNVVRLYIFAAGHLVKRFEKERNIYELT